MIYSKITSRLIKYSILSKSLIHSFRIPLNSSNFMTQTRFLSTPPRFLRYLNRLSHDLENSGDETAAFLLHCPYLAVRWDLVNVFVGILDRWLNEITRPRVLNSIKSADSIPYVLSSLVRLHQRWTFLSDSTEKEAENTLISIENRSPFIRAINGKRFGVLLDQMVDIGFHQCDPDEISKSCQALRYFLNLSIDLSTWPSQIWLNELIAWTLGWLKRSEIRKKCDASVGPTILSSLSRFQEILPSAPYDSILQILADLSKEKFRDYLADRRISGNELFRMRYSFSPLLPSPKIFCDYSSAWLGWRVNPDDSDLAPGSWRVWYETLAVAGRDYAQIGSMQGKPTNSFIVENAPAFSRLLVDMIEAARFFRKETIFFSTGAKGIWQEWALLAAFCCEPSVAAWMLEEFQNVEDICENARGLDSVLPRDILRPQLKTHLEYLASRTNFLDMIE